MSARVGGAERRAPDEVAVGLRVDGPGEAGLERARGLVHVLAVEGHAGLQPQRVAGAEAAGPDVRRREQLPRARGERRGQHELEAVLAGIAGARGEPVAEERALEPPQSRGCSLEAADCGPGELARVRALDRDQREIGARNDGDIERAAQRELAEPGDVLVRGAGVDDQPICLVRDEVRDQIVHHAALPVQEARVERAARRVEPGDVVRERKAEEVARTGAEDLDHAHVRHVEHARRTPDGVMLLDLRAVMEGHLPAGEIDELRPRFAVDGVQRGRLEQARSRKRKRRSEDLAPPSLSSVPERLRGARDANLRMLPACPFGGPALGSSTRVRTLSRAARLRWCSA